MPGEYAGEPKTTLRSVPSLRARSPESGKSPMRMAMSSLSSAISTNASDNCRSTSTLGYACMYSATMGTRNCGPNRTDALTRSMPEGSIRCSISSALAVLISANAGLMRS